MDEMDELEERLRGSKHVHLWPWQVITIHEYEHERRLYNADRKEAHRSGERWPPYLIDTDVRPVDNAGERSLLTYEGHQRLQAAGLFAGEDFDRGTRRYFVIGGRDFALGLTGQVYYSDQFRIMDRGEYWEIAKSMGQPAQLSFESFDSAVDKVIEHYASLPTPNRKWITAWWKILRRLLP